MTYKLTPVRQDGQQAAVIRLADSALIPFDPDNSDYQAYLQWLVDGNTPDPADVPDFPARVAAFEAKVDKRLADAAGVKGYDSILSAALRAGYPGPFHDEGVIYATFMDATWAKCYEVLGAVIAGQRPEPTWEELEALLPAVPTFK